MITKYITPDSFLETAPHIILVGAGGTGSAMVTGLADMATSLPKLGGIGINVTVMDDDRVSTSNIGRQAFAPSDVGQFKADVIVNRVNQCFGLNWTSRVERLTEKSTIADNRNVVLIGCVDTRTARNAIYQKFREASRHMTAWWLDCGNESRYGQCVLGVRHKGRVVVPCVADLFPEVIDAIQDADDHGPSCSLPEALAKQDLFTNRLVANTACNLLWKLFRNGETTLHGAFVNVETLNTNPMNIDPKAWARLGYTGDENVTAEKEVNIKLFEAN